MISYKEFCPLQHLSLLIEKRDILNVIVPGDILITNIYHETMGFTELLELNSTSSWRGAGLIQFTGESNYTACSRELKVTLTPDIIASNPEIDYMVTKWWLLHNRITMSTTFNTFVQKLTGAKGTKLQVELKTRLRKRRKLYGY